tara:strand:- start:155 stop:871 length:717 start_codon:yes stop_codon:yes gene_type:complete
MELENNYNNSISDKVITNNTLVCNKGNMILESYYLNSNDNKSYLLKYSYNKLNLNKININSLLGNDIYDLLEKLNVELIEKIHILNKISEECLDICIIFKHIAKEVGIKRKYIIFRSLKSIDTKNYSINFNIKDLSLIDDTLKNNYKKQLNLLDNTSYEPLIFNYGDINLNILTSNINNFNDIFKNINVDRIIDVDFIMNFQILISDKLPIYMENMIGLLIKKMFYNVKQFVDNLNND